METAFISITFSVLKVLAALGRVLLNALFVPPGLAFVGFLPPPLTQLIAKGTNKLKSTNNGVTNLTPNLYSTRPAFPWSG